MLSPLTALPTRKQELASREVCSYRLLAQAHRVGQNLPCPCLRTSRISHFPILTDSFRPPEPLAAKAKIAELEKKLFTSEALVQVLRREQRENGKLIGEYEQALDKVVGMLRDFAAAQTEEKAALARRYLGMLQAERNEHQQTRFQRDEYLAKVMELAENIRIAYRLRCEESVPDLEIVAGLQTEVRAYRNAMGMEAEKREDETGWPVLKSVKEGEVTSAS